MELKGTKGLGTHKGGGTPPSQRGEEVYVKHGGEIYISGGNVGVKKMFLG